jgi:hypothetical protein
LWWKPYFEQSLANRVTKLSGKDTMHPGPDYIARGEKRRGTAGLGELARVLPPAERRTLL